MLFQSCAGDLSLNLQNLKMSPLDAHKPLRKQFEGESERLVSFYSSSRLYMVKVSRISLKVNSTNNESP